MDASAAPAPAPAPAPGDRVGVYPGSFNPPTVAHLAIADAAMRAGALDRLELVVSRSALGKEAVSVPTIEDRLDVLRRVAAGRPGLAVRLTDHQLLADIAADAAAVVLGADKWAQVIDPAWYGGSVAARDEAVARLPLALVAPRPPASLPAPVDGRVVVLDVPAALVEVSSTAVRGGRHEWMAPEAAAFDTETGAWSDPVRYAALRQATTTEL